MKILKIRLENLNSLKGKFTISFEEAPLRDSGLFLITGNTGAGKSTILDAITLALFGLVPRFEDMNVNRKENQVLTHGCDDCYAEVEFKSHDKVYRSKWSLRKTRTGSFADSKREIALLSPDRTDSEILATKKKDVDALVEDLLGGLDFKRFTRSVLLAQGEFAQFLKGTKDRSTILERITNSDRYSKISIAAFERHKEAILELEKLREQSANVQLLSPEEKEALATALEADKKTLTEKENIRDQQQQQLQLLEKLAQFQAEKKTLETLQETLLLQQEEAQMRFDQLALHQQAKEFKPALDELEQLETQLEKVVEEIKDLTAASLTAKEELAKLQKAQGDLEQDLKDSKADFVAFEKIYDQVVKLDTQIESAAKLVQNLEEELEQLATISTAKAETIEKATAQQKTLASSQKDCATWLKEHQIYQTLVGSDQIFELKTQYKDLQKFDKELKAVSNKHEETQKRLLKLEKQAKAYETALKENSTEQAEQQEAYLELCKTFELDPQFSHEKHIEHLQEMSTQTDVLLQDLRQVEEARQKHQEILSKIIDIDETVASKQIELEEGDLQILQEANALISLRKQQTYYEGVYDEQKEKNGLSAYRGKLKKDEECPLCFSKEQPFRKMKVDISFALKQAKQDLDAAKKKRLESEQKNLKILSEQRALFLNIQELQQSKNDFLKAAGEIETSIQSIIGNKKRHLAPLVFQKKALKEKIDTTASLAKQYVEIERKLQVVHKALESRQKEDQNIQTQLQLNTLHLKDFKQQFSELAVELKHYTKKLASTQSDIEAVLKKYQLHTEISKAIATLEKAKEQYIEQQELQQKIDSDISHLELQIKNDLEQLEEAKKNETLKQKAAKEHFEGFELLKEQRFELFGKASIQLAKEEKSKALKLLEDTLEQNLKQCQDLGQQLATSTGVLQEKDKQQKQLEEKIQLQQPKLLKAVQKIGIESLEMLRNSILEKSVAESIALQQKELQQQLHATSEKLLENAKAFEALLQDLETQLETDKENLAASKEALLEGFLALQEEIKELLQIIGSTKEKLRQQKLQEEQHQALLEVITKHKKEVQRWAKLKELIGSSDGKKFRVFAQSITLRKLIHLANKHLKYFINGRYYLEKRFGEYQDRKPDNMLEIDIVDTFQANNKRPLNTLSGGESFLASLALALGLSDLAGGKATIESLFIDEGFGTLDTDTLQVAIRALQTLQSKGKTIGVISHIEQLKQNIPTQIHVVKKGGGFSHMKIEEV